MEGGREMQKAEEIQSKKNYREEGRAVARAGESILSINKLWKVHTVGKNSRAW